jgi:hypothetical protein
MEIWKNIDEFYRVSNLGNVESFKYGYWKPIKKSKIGNGYLGVMICYNNKPKRQYVHRLVANAFILNNQNKPQVNHINGIKSDNRVENLEWVTQSENNKHSYDSGIKKPTNQKGINNGNVKLSNEQILEIRNIYDKGNISKLKLASIYGVSDVHICRIVKRQMRNDI